MIDIETLSKLLVEAAQVGYLVGIESVSDEGNDLERAGLVIANLVIDNHLSKLYK